MRNLVIAAVFSCLALAGCLNSSGDGTSSIESGTDAQGWEVSTRETIDNLNGADFSHPRILMSRDQIGVVQSRLGRYPYDYLFHELYMRAINAAQPNSDDQCDCVETRNRSREAEKAKAAKNLAFMYAVARTWDDDLGMVRVADSTELEQMAEKVRAYLRFMCTESRIKIQVDRDIDTAKELEQYANAYDLMLGAGYDFGEYADDIRNNIKALLEEYYGHYMGRLDLSSIFDPEEGGDDRYDIGMANLNIIMSRFLVNNHRTHGASAIGIAALALADNASDFNEGSEFRKYIDFAVERIDLVQRYTYGAGDGAYGEGPYYLRYASTGFLPFITAWDRLTGSNDWETEDGIIVPSYLKHPQFAAMMRWLLDTTVPDGSTAPIDDGYVGQSMYFGALPAFMKDGNAFIWRWMNCTQPYVNDASHDMAAFEIVAYDDQAYNPASPEGSPTRFYIEGGNIIFRSSWNEEAVMVLVQGENGPAREFGRQRDGTGEIYSGSHDHPDPGSFLMYAYGERLLIDPGYMDYPYSLQRVMSKPSDHNMILVKEPLQPESPGDPLSASIVPSPRLLAWELIKGSPAPIDGNATISHTLDSDFVDAATVTSRYGHLNDGDWLEDEGLTALATFLDRSTIFSSLVQRRFLFIDDRYLIIADALSSPVKKKYVWPVHGNGGGTEGYVLDCEEKDMLERPPLGADAINATAISSKGSFERKTSGAVWSRNKASISFGIVFDDGKPDFTEDIAFHEVYNEQLANHAVLYAAKEGRNIRSVSAYYPMKSDAAPAVITDIGLKNAAGLLIRDGSSGNLIAAINRTCSLSEMRRFECGSPALKTITTDATFVVAETDGASNLKFAYAENAKFLSVNGKQYFSTRSPSTLAIKIENDCVKYIVDNDETKVSLYNIPFEIKSADGVRGFINGKPAVVIKGNESRFEIYGYEKDNQAPYADAGKSMKAEPGTVVRLDGSSSFDVDGDRLAPQWKLVSSPPGTSWTFRKTNTFNPELPIEKPGPYRVELVVTDERGLKSRPARLLIIAGSGNSDSVDNDLDGYFDFEDINGEKGFPSDQVTGFLNDSDYDGIPDFIEFFCFSSINNFDTDGDRMPDGYEIRNSLNPLIKDAGKDMDGDGYSNYTEYIAGTDPADSMSRP